MGVPLVWAVGVGVALLFPVLLLSMLVANSPLHLLSLRVWRSLVAWRIRLDRVSLDDVRRRLSPLPRLEIALWRHAGWAIDVAVTGDRRRRRVGWSIFVCWAAWRGFFPSIWGACHSLTPSGPVREIAQERGRRREATSLHDWPILCTMRARYGIMA